MERLDSFLIDQWFQPLAHRIQRRFGWTCYKMAWLLIGTTMVLFMLQVYWDVQTRGWNSVITIYGLAVLPILVLMLSYRLTMLERRDRDGWRNTLNGDRHGTVARFRVGVLLWVVAINAFGIWLITLGKPLFEELLDRLPMTLWITADYFAACTPLPPGWQRQERRTEVFQPS